MTKETAESGTARTRLRAFALGMLITAGVGFAGVGALPSAEAETACSGHTDATSKDCSSQCPSGHVIGVYINVDDTDETSSASTSCSNQAASCPPQAGRDECQAESPGPTAAGGGWTCRFESVDPGIAPNNGFQYNCYSYAYSPPPPPSPPPPKTDVGVRTSAASGTSVSASGACAGATAAGTVHGLLLAELCAILGDEDEASRILVPHADRQIIVHVRDGAAAGILCSESGCVPVNVLCRSTAEGFACDALSPRLDA